MKKIYLLIICTIILLTTNVHAFELSCEKCSSIDGGCEYQDTFYCDIKNPLPENSDPIRYDYIKGKITGDSDVSCSFYNSSLDVIADSSRTFNLKGTPTSDTIVSVECTVSGQARYRKYINLKIDDFEYSINKEISNTVLTSNQIIINKVDESKIIEKSRDTTNEDSLIKSLSIKEVEIKFSKYTTEYEITVPYEVESLDFTYALNSKSSTYEIVGDPKHLQVGLNTIDFFITSAARNETCYTFYVTRNPKGKTVYIASKDATLKNINVVDYELDFKEDVTEYELTVKRGTKKLQISAAPTVTGATYQVLTPDKYVTGSKVEIVVTSSDKSTKKTYTIKIKTEGGVIGDNSEMIIFVAVSVVAAIVGVAIFALLIVKKKKKNNMPKAEIDNSKFTDKNANNAGTIDDGIEMPIPKQDPSFIVPPAPVTMPDTFRGTPTAGNLGVTGSGPAPVEPTPTPIEPAPQQPQQSSGNNNQNKFFNNY